MKGVEEMVSVICNFRKVLGRVGRERKGREEKNKIRVR